MCQKTEVWENVLVHTSGKQSSTTVQKKRVTTHILESRGKGITKPIILSDCNIDTGRLNWKYQMSQSYPKSKLSLCLIKQYAMKAQGRV